MGDGASDKEEFERFLRERFLSGAEETGDHQKIDGIEDLISKHQNNSIGSFLLDAAMIISRQFEFKEVSIGLKDKADGLFKYGVTLGFMPATQEALRKITYTDQDMMDHVKYPDVKIGRVSEFCFSSPLGQEQRAFNRPGLLGKPRSAMDEFMEGDYIDIYMYGAGDELIGWVELAGPKSGKVPDRPTMKWLELIAAVISRIVWERMYAHDAPRSDTV